MRGIVALVLVLIASQAFAQDTAAPADPGPSAYPIAQLQREVAPLYADELTELADAWQASLRAAVDELARLQLDGAGGEAIAAAESERNAIAQRLGVVLGSLDSKGGDPSVYQDYIDATSGVSVNWFDPEAVSDYLTAWVVSPEGGVRIGLNIVKFIAIVFVAWLVSRVVGFAVGTAVRRLPKTSELLRAFVVSLVRRTIQIVGFVVALGALGLNIGPLVAAIGAAGLVIGLALQGTLSNFASGILILVYRPFDVGDVINAGGVAGKVEAMSLVSTRMLTFDNQVQFVPNNSIWNGVITNITGLSTRRVDMTFGIGYADDMAKAEAIIRDVIGSHEKVLADPETVIKVHELADNSVNFIARPWSKTADYWDVYWDVTRTVKERFDAEGVGIPFPQRDIHIPEALRVVVTNDAVTA